MVESRGRGYDKVVAACEAVGAVLPTVDADFGGLMVRIDESPRYQELRLERPDQSHETVNETDRAPTEHLAEALLTLLARDSAATYDEILPPGPAGTAQPLPGYSSS